MKCNSPWDGKFSSVWWYISSRALYLWTQAQTAFGYFRSVQNGLADNLAIRQNQQTSSLPFPVDLSLRSCTTLWWPLSSLLPSLFHTSAFACLRKILFPRCLLAPSGLSISSWYLFCSLFLLFHMFCPHRSSFSLLIHLFDISHILFLCSIILVSLILLRGASVVWYRATKGKRHNGVNSDRVEKSKVSKNSVLFSLWFPVLLSFQPVFLFADSLLARPLHLTYQGFEEIWKTQIVSKGWKIHTFGLSYLLKLEFPVYAAKRYCV